MSDRFAAEIRMGGKATRSKLKKLCQAINAEGVCRAWGEAYLKDVSPENILEFRNDEGHLWFCDEQAGYGEFEVLEKALVELGIPFDRDSEGKYEYDAETRAFRPGQVNHVQITSHEGAPVVHVAAVAKALEALKAGKVKKAIEILEKLCPKEPSPLPPFEIV